MPTETRQETQAEKYFYKIWASIGLGKSYELNLFLGTEILKSYGKEIIKQAIAAAPESADKLKGIVLE